MGVLLFEEREEFIADFVAEESVGSIGGIGAKRKFACRDVIEDIGSRSIEERADEEIIFRTHRGKSAQPGSSKEVEQECLGLVVLVVRGEDVL